MMDYSETNFVEEYQPGNDARVELKNGRFLDVINGRYFDAGVSVIAEDGKIKSMPGLAGEPGEITPDFTIDLKGKTVLPGLFNTHCHINLTSTTILPALRDIRLGRRCGEHQKAKNMAECLAHGVTNIRDAYIEDLRPNRALREGISKGEIPGPRFLQAVVVGPPGGYLTEKSGLLMRLMRSALGMPPFDHSRAEAGVVEFPIDATEKQVRDAVDRAIDERGAEVIKIGEQLENMTNLKPDSTIMTIDQLCAVTDQARRRGLKSTMHQVSVDSFRRGVKAGVSSLAHIAGDTSLTQEDVDAFKAAGCIIEPTLSGVYNISWKIKGDQWYDHPEMNRLTEFRHKTYTYAALADEYFIPELRDRVTKSYNKMASGKFKMLGVIGVSRMFRYYSGLVSDGFENFRMLFEQGARMALANDGGIPPCTPAMMGFELAMFDFVLSREPDSKQLSGAEAARIATINSAQSMGLEREFGSIEVGKTADLAIVDGDPLENFHVVGSRVAALFMDGKLVINNCGLQVKSVGEA